MNVTLTPAEQFCEETRKETKSQPSVIDHITHDIINQLSVISLCCCELRNSVGENLESDRLKEFTRIENAVQNAADMIQQLKAVVQDHGPTCNDRSLESVLNRAEAVENFSALSRFLLRR
jgi:ribulose-5-phosphate 4-epimerase/fuculose-1-phosphate aldolase